MQKKKGISLIVLVITIIVMIILAAAIILSLNNAGIIGNANKAVSDMDYKNIQTAAGLKYSDILLGEKVTGMSIGDWIKNKLIEDGTITEEKAKLYRFKNDGTVVRLGTEAEYDYTSMPTEYYTISATGEFSLTTAGKTAADNGTLTEIVVPYGVKALANNAMSYCDSITTLILPDTVEVIGEYACAQCTSLTNVTMSKNIKEIKVAAFRGTPWLASMTTDDGLVIVDTCLIDGKSATGDVVIPKTVESISYSAFHENENITSITIPNTVTSIGAYAFRYCYNLATVNGLENIVDVDQYAFTSTKWYDNLPDGPVYVGTNFYVYKGSTMEDTDFELKAGTTSITSYAFSYVRTLITSVTIPDTVTSIGQNAFASCSNLASANIPKSLKYLGEEAFSGCSNLAMDVVFPEGMTEIESYTFRNCKKITSATIPDSITTIGNFAFQSCDALTNVVVNNVEQLGSGAFFNTPWYDNLKANYTSGVLMIGKAVVDGSKATGKVVIPEETTHICVAAFANNTGITSVEMSEGVRIIDTRAFEGCTALTSVNIPATVTRIEMQAFNGCTSLSSLRFDGNIPYFGQSALWDTALPAEQVTEIDALYPDAYFPIF